MKVVIASDLSCFPVKVEIAKHLRGRRGIEVLDFGIASVDQPKPYVEQAPRVACAIQANEADRGILMCGTGRGMAIAASKHKGIYGCVVADVFTGERARIVNNANVLTLHGWITAPFLAREIVDAWLSVSFARKMEAKRDFLSAAFRRVTEIEGENFW